MTDTNIYALGGNRTIDHTDYGFNVTTNYYLSGTNNKVQVNAVFCATNFYGGNGFSQYDISGDATIVTTGRNNVFNIYNPMFNVVTIDAGRADNLKVVADPYSNTFMGFNLSFVGQNADIRVSPIFNHGWINGGSGHNYFSVGSGMNLNLSGQYNTIDFLKFQEDSFIKAGTGYDTVNISVGDFSANTTVQLAGYMNVINESYVGNTGAASDAETLYISGGAGKNTYNLQGAAHAVASGLDNHFYLDGFENATAIIVDAGAGHGDVHVTDGLADVTFHGNANSIDFGAAAGGAVHDLSNGLVVNVDAGARDIDIFGFGATRGYNAIKGGVVDLRNGAGGFHSVAEVLAALHSDGAGGLVLDLGTGVIHFHDVASLNAYNFILG